jgi:hypothetical protein
MVRDLAEGMFGIDVKAIQQALNIWMPDRKALVDDGKFGPLTKAAGPPGTKRSTTIDPSEKILPVYRTLKAVMRAIWT